MANKFYKIRRKADGLFFAPTYGKDNKFNKKGKVYQSRPCFRNYSHIIKKGECELVSFEIVELGAESFNPVDPTMPR
jgi:hypothetical protein